MADNTRKTSNIIHTVDDLKTDVENNSQEIQNNTDAINSLIIPKDANDGTIKLNSGKGINVTGTDATANQSRDTSWSVAVDDTVALKSDIPEIPEIPVIPAPVVPGDGAINLTQGNGITVAGSNATANQTGNTGWTVKTDNSYLNNNLNFAKPDQIPTNYVKDIQSGNILTLTVDDEDGVYTLTALGASGGGAGNIIFEEGEGIDITSEIVDIGGEEYTKYTIKADKQWLEDNIAMPLPISSTDGLVTLQDDGSGTFQIKTGPAVGQVNTRVEVNATGDLIANKKLRTNEITTKLDGAGDPAITIGEDYLTVTEASTPKALIGYVKYDRNTNDQDAGSSVQSRNGSLTAYAKTAPNTNYVALDLYEQLNTPDSSVSMQWNAAGGAFASPAAEIKSTRAPAGSNFSLAFSAMQGNSLKEYLKMEGGELTAVSIRAPDISGLDDNDASVTLDSSVTISGGAFYLNVGSPAKNMTIGSNTSGVAGGDGVYFLSRTHDLAFSSNEIRFNSDWSGGASEPTWVMTEDSGFVGNNNFNYVKCGSISGTTDSDASVTLGGDLTLNNESGIIWLGSSTNAPAGATNLLVGSSDGDGKNLLIASGQPKTAAEAGSALSFATVAGNGDRARKTRMFIDPEGNVGIDDVSPDERLCVGGSIKANRLKGYGDNPQLIFESQQTNLTANDGSEYVPSDDSSLVTRKWVEANAASGDFLPLAGGTFDNGVQVVMPSGGSVNPVLQVGGLTTDAVQSQYQIAARGTTSKKNSQVVSLAKEGGKSFFKLGLERGTTVLDTYWNFAHTVVQDFNGNITQEDMTIGNKAGNWLLFRDDQTGKNIASNYTFHTQTVSGLADNDASISLGSSLSVETSGVDRLVVSNDQSTFSHPIQSTFVAVIDGGKNRALLGDTSYKRNNNDTDAHASISSRNGALHAYANTIADQDVVALDIYEGVNNVGAGMSIQWNNAGGAFNCPASEILSKRVAGGANFSLTFSAMVGNSLQEHLTLSDGQLTAYSGYEPSGDSSLVTKKYVDDNAGGGGVSGVSKIIGGTNITVSPLGGTGNVTVNADLSNIDVGVTKIIGGENVTVSPAGGTGNVIINATSSAGGADSLVELDDVVVTDPKGNEVLTYDIITRKWINKAPPSGGGGGGIIDGGQVPGTGSTFIWHDTKYAYLTNVDGEIADDYYQQKPYNMVACDGVFSDGTFWTLDGVNMRVDPNAAYIGRYTGKFQCKYGTYIGFQGRVIAGNYGYWFGTYFSQDMKQWGDATSGFTTSYSCLCQQKQRPFSMYLASGGEIYRYVSSTWQTGYVTHAEYGTIFPGHVGTGNTYTANQRSGQETAMALEGEKDLKDYKVYCLDIDTDDLDWEGNSYDTATRDANSQVIKNGTTYIPSLDGCTTGFFSERLQQWFFAKEDTVYVSTTDSLKGTWVQKTLPRSNGWDRCYDDGTAIVFAKTGTGNSATVFTTDNGVSWKVSISLVNRDYTNFAGTNGRAMATWEEAASVPGFIPDPADPSGEGVLPVYYYEYRYALSGVPDPNPPEASTRNLKLAHPVSIASAKAAEANTQSDANEVFTEEIIANKGEIVANKEEIAKKTAVITLTQVEYDALGADVDQDTLYLITF